MSSASNTVIAVALCLLVAGCQSDHRPASYPKQSTMKSPPAPTKSVYFAPARPHHITIEQDSLLLSSMSVERGVMVAVDTFESTNVETEGERTRVFIGPSVVRLRNMRSVDPSEGPVSFEIMLKAPFVLPLQDSTVRVTRLETDVEAN